MKEVYDCPRCGCSRFTGNQNVSMEVIVDGSGEWLENIEGGIYESERPFGPFVCRECRTCYDNLPIPVSEDEVASKIAKTIKNPSEDVTSAIDGAVHDLFSKRASAVNNGGVQEQLKFLVEELGEDEVKRLIAEAKE